MIIDFLDFPDDQMFQADVCIIGSGAAGLTIAREFFNTNTTVLILEGGGERFEKDSHDLYTSEITALPHNGIHAGRARIFGGTTTLWAGQTLPLDEIDFRYRPWVTGSGWPLSQSDLEPYYRRAEEALHLEPIDYACGRWPFSASPPPAYHPAKLRPLISQFSPKPNFARAYRAALKAARNITLMLHANAVGLRATAEAAALESVEIRSLAGKRGYAKARFYVICCGGIETARLLLASNDVERGGLGNRHDLVGRYFQEHVQARLARIHLRDPAYGLGLYEPFYWKGVAYNPKAALSEAIQEGRETLNAVGGVMRAELPPQDSPVEAAKRLLKGILNGYQKRSLGSDLRRVLGGPHEVAAAVFRRFVQHKPAFKMTGDTYISLQGECEPNPASRVLLSTERDALGMPRTKLEWRLTPLVRHTALVLLETLGAELKRLQIGEVDPDSCELALLERNWEGCFRDTNHHIGTCRMSSDPTKGVVNPDCRLHTVENLFVSSSAVFPTGGHSNPTFTILALGIRLADHLKNLLGRGV